MVIFLLTKAPKAYVRKRGRWGPPDQKVIMPGLPTILPAVLTEEQMDAYILTMRIEDITRRLRDDEVVPIWEEPTTDPAKLSKYRTALEEERNRLSEIGVRRLPTFRPPQDFRSKGRYSEKVFLPAREYPHVNFIGLLIGPRGNTLKKLETQSGVKISIRGKGAAKEGKSGMIPGEDEELHCLIMSDSEDKIRKAIVLIAEIVDTAKSVPDGSNELKKMQLKELAALNGTLRNDEEIICLNCGEYGHRKFECPHARNVTSSMVCKICGGTGHLSSDCMYKNDPGALEAARKRDMIMDHEYASLMAELGGGKGAAKKEGAWPVPGAGSAPNSAIPPTASGLGMPGMPPVMPGLPGMTPAVQANVPEFPPQPYGILEVPPGTELPPHLGGAIAAPAGIPGMPPSMPKPPGHISNEPEQEEYELPPGVEINPYAHYAYGYGAATTAYGAADASQYATAQYSYPQGTY